MGIDKKFLAENYKRMPDEELLSIISNDYNDLAPEAKEVLQQELASRGLGDGVDSAIEMQVNGVSDEILKEYLEIIRNMPCPICAKVENRLNAIIVVRGQYEDFVIACPACLSKELANAQATSLGTGFFGGIRGIARAAKQTSAYNTYTKQINSGQPTSALISFIKKKLASSNYTAISLKN